MKIAVTVLVLFGVTFCTRLKAQERKIVEFWGEVVNDSLQGIPYVHIINVREKAGTISGYYGNFAFAAFAGDTILFSAVGFQRREVVIPSDYSKETYYRRIKLYYDNIMLKETVILPWSTYEQFKLAVVNYSEPDDDMAKARRNIERIVQEIKLDPYTMSAEANYRYFMYNYVNRYNGGYYGNNWLNPIAWAKFIEALKNGELKQEKKKK